MTGHTLEEFSLNWWSRALNRDIIHFAGSLPGGQGLNSLQYDMQQQQIPHGVLSLPLSSRLLSDILFNCFRGILFPGERDYIILSVPSFQVGWLVV